MIALSFLGLGRFNEETKSYNYEKANYLFNGKTIETDHFPFAVNEFIKPDKFFVIMTEKAKEHHYNKLKELCNFEEILIPDGKSEEEFWIIFDKITEVISENEEVVFDITHGFRSQPFIVIVLLLYLKALKNIKIKNILYGAFEAKDKQNVTPVFELKSFIDLIDWSNAVHEFVKNGNMKYLNSILSEIHKISRKTNSPNPSKQLKGAGTDLANLTDAFSAIRLNEIFETTSNFNRRLNDLLNDLENHPQAKPFKTLLETIVIKFMPISKAEKKLFSAKGFDAQKSIMSWYIETNKYQKAITLAREYIVTKYMDEIEGLSEAKLLIRGSREAAEKKLGGLLSNVKNGFRVGGREGEYVKLWCDISKLRNDINHAGMSKNPKTSKSIINETEKIISKINSTF